MVTNRWRNCGGIFHEATILAKHRSYSLSSSKSAMTCRPPLMYDKKYTVLVRIRAWSIKMTFDATIITYWFIIHLFWYLRNLCTVSEKHWIPPEYNCLYFYKYFSINLVHEKDNRRALIRSNTVDRMFIINIISVTLTLCAFCLFLDYFEWWSRSCW